MSIPAKKRNRSGRILNLLRRVRSSSNPSTPVERLEDRRLLAFGPLGDPFLVNTITTNNQINPAVAVHPTSGEFVVVWQGPETGTIDDIWAQRYDALGNKVGTEFRVNTFTTGQQRFPSVAMDNNGNFAVAWQSNGQESAGSGYGIYVQRYNAAGVAQGAEEPVNTYTTGNQRDPSIAMDADGDFVVAWRSFAQDGDSYGVYAQRFVAGAKNGTEIAVNSVTAGSQTAPSVSMDPNGDFVVAWNSSNQVGAGSGFDIYVRQFDAVGTPADVEFHVNTDYTTAAQQNPSVAVAPGGSFVVAWESSAQDGNLYGVYARKYNNSGTALTDPFKVNEYTTGSQRSAAVDIDETGDFIVTWASNGQDGSLYGIYGKRYTAAGTPVEAEFVVNTYTTGTQFAPAVAMEADGDFVIAFHSDAQDGSLFGVYARRYGDPTATPAPTITDDGFVWQDAPQRLVITFDQDVSASLGADDLLLENLTTATTIATANIAVTWNGATNTATFTWITLPNHALPNGNYRATIMAAGVANGGGTPMAADYVAAPFFFLNGDFDQSRTVDITDLGNLATHWQSAAQFVDGDANYDGFVDITDLGILATNWQVSIAAPAPLASVIINPATGRVIPTRSPIRARESAGTVVDSTARARVR